MSHTDEHDLIHIPMVEFGYYYYYYLYRKKFYIYGAVIDVMCRMVYCLCVCLCPGLFAQTDTQTNT